MSIKLKSAVEAFVAAAEKTGYMIKKGTGFCSKCTQMFPEGFRYCPIHSDKLTFNNMDQDDSYEYAFTKGLEAAISFLLKEVADESVKT
tara:strand:- start:275 stop:541 length:267 start_codon:yes stop_codon:yes gene_type:complete